MGQLELVLVHILKRTGKYQGQSLSMDFCKILSMGLVCHHEQYAHLLRLQICVSPSTDSADCLFCGTPNETDSK